MKTIIWYKNLLNVSLAIQMPNDNSSSYYLTDKDIGLLSLMMSDCSLMVELEIYQSFSYQVPLTVVRINISSNNHNGDFYQKKHRNAPY